MLDNEIYRNEVHCLNRDTGVMPFAEVSSSLVIPNTPKGGLLVRVCYAGACYNENQFRRRGIRPRFPGYEIAGIIEDVCNTLPNSNYTPGDKVIIFPDDKLSESGYKEFIAISDTSQVLQIPRNLQLDIAAMLPGGALTAYSAVLKAKPHVEKLKEVKACVNVLIVGAGGLGLWTLKIANYLISGNCSEIKLFVADNSIDKLLTAQDHKCYDIIHWNEEDHEEYIAERTIDACRGGVDVIIDFVSSPRTMQRSLKVLNREGLILVGGNSMSEVSISLNALAAKQQSIVGIPKGSMNQLRELVRLVAEQKLEIPQYAVFPVEEANQVFKDLCDCRITGRAIFKFGNINQTAMDNATHH
ncbi:zeta-crystallin-like isoform X2 [Gigantopelta aegis]|uniref:zeta-crystallin-like isoform X2 n=1 Tax=Gigantopelta aegis TaxID=1735272 RepID=UPI001B88CE13|nr:zeta-crystallin-like isoform X2 [Gigantopelta aegis]